MRRSRKNERNVYDGERRVARVERSGAAPTDYFSYDVFGNVTAESNSVASVAHSRDNLGMDTNEVTTVGAESFSLERAYDDCRRLAVMRRGGGATAYAYAADGKLASISNADACVEYAYAPDRRGLGYTLTLPNGGVFSRGLARHRYIRSNVEKVVNSFNGIAVSDLSYTNDALGRPVSRNADTFAYNPRGELASARISGGLASYCYDSIGNVTTSATASSATEFAADSRNAYSQILKDGTPVSVARDLDGNLANYGCWTYSHDSASRMTSAMSNGVTVASMSYDALGRRVMKSTQSGTRIYFYDCNLLVREVYLRNDGTRSVTDYFWGADISGEIGEAAGIGGLLYVKRDGEVYIPFCDAYGNVLGYMDGDGDVVASYAYDAFGDAVSVSGGAAEQFAFRYSTKYYDEEFDSYYYGCRYYLPKLMRWMTEDPAESVGGVNPYMFCDNAAVHKADIDGRYTWTEETAVAEIRKKIEEMKSHGYNFGAEALEYFLGNHEQNTDMSHYASEIYNHPDWQKSFMSSVRSQLMKKDPKGTNKEVEIGDTAHRAAFASDLSTGAIERMFSEQFAHRFYPNQSMSLFYALFGSHYSYVGTGSWCAKSESYGSMGITHTTVTLDLQMVSWDMLTYGGGAHRKAFPSYSAAHYLEKEKRYNHPYLYLMWNEKGSWEVTDWQAPYSNGSAPRRLY